MADVMICAQSAQVLVDATDATHGERLEWVTVDRTTAHADHPVVTGYPHLWRPLVIDYPSPTAEAADDDEAESEDASEPAAKDVRAWAKENGIDVPERGKLPAEVVERYNQAHGGG